MSQNPTLSGVTPEGTAVKERFDRCVIPVYGRFDMVLTRSEGSYVLDDRNRRYLDVGAGVAVCALGHCHPAIAEAISRQVRQLIHVSNLYYHDLQGRFAEELVDLIGPGKCFFCSSGVEANEALFKLARKVGSESGRFEVITCQNSFHGRTLAGISATGQQKVKTGFEPLVPGFRHVPFDSLKAAEEAISPATIAVMIEGIQGEGGINVASPEFLLGLRSLCDERGLLLLFDGVQCGHFRTGRFQSYQRILEGYAAGEGFLPDAISMAKSLGGGFPLGAIWVNERYADVLGPGTHGATFGGTPLASAVGLAVLAEIEASSLEQNARDVGDCLRVSLMRLQEQYPAVIKEVRGLGLMLGVEFAESFSKLLTKERPISLQVVEAVQREGMLTIPAGQRVIRFLPPLNLKREEAEEAIVILQRTIEKLIA
ncbi:MAG: Acetylornithine aminotransferase [Verrucomicrobia subdivision 3 bacterium]|nr:Acetylornithine aminotransferase [Limisphaerales bacterium]MCS1414609.1 Acetylornithine aminotransferase [Limisphaerales bacterium]